MSILFRLGYSVVDAFITTLLIKVIFFYSGKIEKKRFHQFFRTMIIIYFSFGFIEQPVRMILLNIIYIALSKILLKVRLNRGMIISIVTSCIFFIISILYQVVLSNIFHVNIINLNNILFSPIKLGGYTFALISSLCIWGASVFFRRRKKLFNRQIYLKVGRNILGVLFALTCIISFIIIEVFFKLVLSKDVDLNIKKYINIMGFFIIILMILIIGAYTLLVKQKAKIDRKNFEFEQLKSYSELFEGMAMEFTRYKHDFKNTILPIGGFIYDEDYQGLKDYYYNEVISNQQQIEEKHKTYMPLSFIKNSGLKGLIISKINRAFHKEMKIKVEIFEEISIPKDKTREVSEVTGILLDNAIEAAENSEDKEVIICALKDNKHTSIIVANTYSTKPNLAEIFKRGYSTKGKGRGSGLYIAKEMLKKEEHIRLESSINKDMLYQEIIIDF